MTDRLVVLLPNAVGDVVLNLPGLGLLQAAGFDMQICGPSYAHDLLGRLPYALVTAAEGKLLRQQFRDLGGRYGLTMRPSFRSAVEMRLAALKGIGFRSQGRRFLLWRTLERPRRVLKVEEYYRLALFTVAVCRGDGPPTSWQPPPYPELPLADHHLEGGRELLDRAGVSVPYVVCCATAAPRYRPGWKIWTGFPELVGQLLSSGATVVTCPAPGEEAQCAELAPGSTMLTGVGLGFYAAILAEAAGVISNDTGPLHLAAAVAAPTLGIFGDTTPVRYAPWGEHATHVGDLGRWPTVEEGWKAFERIARPFRH